MSFVWKNCFTVQSFLDDANSRIWYAETTLSIKSTNLALPQSGVGNLAVVTLDRNSPWLPKSPKIIEKVNEGKIKQHASFYMETGSANMTANDSMIYMGARPVLKNYSAIYVLWKKIEMLKIWIVMIFLAI